MFKKTLTDNKTYYCDGQRKNKKKVAGNTRIAQ